MVVATRFLLLCAAVLALPTIAAAQTTPPPLAPGWYQNGALIYENNIPGDVLEGLSIEWESSYIYQYPGQDPLYWYAKVAYLNKGSNTLTIGCTGLTDPSLAIEHMRGTPNSGLVPAEETFCSRNPTFTGTLKPGETAYDWAIFHNVAWQGGEVSLDWFNQGSSPWVDPWHSPYPLGEIPPPAECPSELVTFGTCMPVLRKPGETASTAANLIVLVHGCCTNANNDLNEWYQLGRKIAARLFTTSFPDDWELVVWDWTKDTPKDRPDMAGIAYNHAIQQSLNLSLLIAPHTYRYIHLIGHSAGARLIDLTAARLASHYNTKPDSERPYIHLTFLDAYTPTGDTYGKLDGYPQHFSEQYVDRTDSTIPGLLTNTILPNAVNFDITHWDMKDWEQISNDDKRDSGHHWPRYWYEKSVTLPTLTPYGYHLSFEGSGITALNEFASLRAGECIELLGNDEEAVCQ